MRILDLYCRTHKQEVKGTPTKYGYSYSCGCKQYITRDLTDDPETWDLDEWESLLGKG